MKASTETRPSLLIRVRDSKDEQAWRVFIEIYTPLVHGFARNRGLQEADAADLAQDVLQRVAKAIARFDYDPNQGTFRSWLFRITRNSLADYAERAKRQPPGSGDTRLVHLLNEQQAANELEQTWDREHASYVLRWGLKKLRADFEPSTIEAFERTMLHEEKPAAVAESLGISVGAVYIAKSRALVRLREIIQEVEGELPSELAT